MSSERLPIEEEPVPEGPERAVVAKPELGAEREATFEKAAEKVADDGREFHRAKHDPGGEVPKEYHTSEHLDVLKARGEKLADVFNLSPERRAVLNVAIAWHDTVIEYDAAKPDDVTAMIRRHRGAREGDQPSGAEGNEAKSARLTEQEMSVENMAGDEVFTDEHIRVVRQAIEATYPDANLGPDFKGAPFKEYEYYQTAIEQNPDLKNLFDELEAQGVTKGPLFSQPHLENALEKGESVPREVLITALADLGAAGCAEDFEFFREGNGEMRELYENLRRTDTMRRLLDGDTDTDKNDRAKATVALTGWLNSQPGFAAWQALRFEKIVHLLKKQNALTAEEESGLRGQFSRYAENARAAQERARNVKREIDGWGAVGEKLAFRYLFGTLGFHQEFLKKESVGQVSVPKPDVVPEKESGPEQGLEEARGSYVDAYRKWAREPKRHRASREVFQGQAELLQHRYERVLENQAREYYSRRRGELELKEGIDASEIEELEKRLRAETFREFVVNEQDTLNRAKAESLPPKDQSIFKKALNKWSHLPKAARWAISAGIATGAAVAFTGLAAGGAAGVALYAGARLGRAVLSGFTTLGADQLIRYGLKGWDKFIGKKKTREYRVGELEAEGTEGIESNLKEVEEKYRTILEETARRERRRNLGRFVAAAAAGGAAGVLGGGLIDKLLGATPPVEVPEAVPETEAPPVPIEMEVEMEAPETSPAPEALEIPETFEAPPSSVLEHLEYRGGPHVWGEIERQVGARTSFKGIFEGMMGDELEAHRTHFIDYFKDKIYEHPEAYGFPKGVDGLSETELRNADWDKLFNEVASSSEEMRRALPHLTPDEVHSIIESNERMKELFAARSAPEPVGSFVEAEAPEAPLAVVPTEVPIAPVEPETPFVEVEAPEAPTVEPELIKPEVPAAETDVPVQPGGREVKITIDREDAPETIPTAPPEELPASPSQGGPAETLGESYYARMQEDGGTLLKRITPDAASETAYRTAAEHALHTDALVHEVAVKLVPSHDTSFLHLSSLAQGEGLTEAQANQFVEYLMQRRGNRRLRRGLLAFFMDKEPSPNSIFKQWVWNDDKFKVTVRRWLEERNP